MLKTCAVQYFVDIMICYHSKVWDMLRKKFILLFSKDTLCVCVCVCVNKLGSSEFSILSINKLSSSKKSCQH